MTQRVCFQLQIDPARRDDYVARHRAVWPEMLDALRSAGWHNYSLYLTDGGELIGYFECDDLASAQAKMAATAVNARWQEEMKQFFLALGTRAPDEGISPIPEIFHLD
jgi:L-rhamnose mutarotase